MTITSFNAKSKLSGRSSGVERNLAKVEVEGSNPFARSKKGACLEKSSPRVAFKQSFI